MAVLDSILISKRIKVFSIYLVTTFFFHRFKTNSAIKILTLDIEIVNAGAEEGDPPFRHPMLAAFATSISPVRSLAGFR